MHTKHVQVIRRSLEMTLLELPSIVTNGADIKFAKNGVLDEVSVCMVVSRIHESKSVVRVSKRFRTDFDGELSKKMCIWKSCKLYCQ